MFKAGAGTVVSLDLSTYILIGYLEDVKEESLICCEWTYLINTVFVCICVGVWGGIHATIYTKT